MANLTAAKRKTIPASKFAGAGKSFPVNDAEHARLAIGGATRSENAGNISGGEAAKIKAKARAVLSDSGSDAPAKSAARAKAAAGEAKAKGISDGIMAKSGR